MNTKERQLAALLRERHEFPDMPGPGEGMVSTDETWAEQEEWRKAFDALHRRIMAALTPIESGDTPVSTTAEKRWAFGVEHGWPSRHRQIHPEDKILGWQMPSQEAPSGRSFDPADYPYYATAEEAIDKAMGVS